MLADTHCHLDWQAFDVDRDQVIRRAVETDVTRLLTIGVDLPSSRRAIELTEKFPSVYAAVGLHPNDCAGFNARLLDEVRALAQQPKVVAIGEIGLDYYWHKVAPGLQAEAFEAQLELAAELDKPVVIHNREATQDVLRILIKHAPRNRGVLHSFFDTLEVAQRAIELGYLIGFTGPITFKKAEHERRVAQRLPLDRILIETDAPFLTPVPHRGRRNEPAYVRHVAEQIAAVKEISFETVARQTTLNAGQLLGWPAG
jgi:TatD DNase family protein